ncbi:TonB-dependent receptor [Ornithobacterium rhinotracheale]|uniref:TonB-dependent receptor n=1 Tax=Ornithobacterium rhinotracheale TaxID=28251 RepID=UPI00129D0777|nr:TonB-dependent receptor [Ornithobacterium rhinotracheale]MRI63212.1 TonB-dependent receptor [Ornithobacterium rhinotracheale]
MLGRGDCSAGKCTIEGGVTDSNNYPVSGAVVKVVYDATGAVYVTETNEHGQYSAPNMQSEGTYTVIVDDAMFPKKEIKGVHIGNAKVKHLNVQLGGENIGLDEVVIVGSGIIDLVKDRQTPIAVSNITKADIELKAGNGDFSELMKNTPSIQIAGQASGYGDSRINVRGFKQDNTAYLLNGQPINGMEDGKVYWSNWAGMSDIANAIQIQRGLGSSKLAISSVGGTVNIVTKATDMRPGGVLRMTAGNNGFAKSTVGYSTGMVNNFGVSALFTYWQGNGYNDQTAGRGQTYFLSFGWQPSENHNLNFLITGAPQWHDQAAPNTIATFLKYGKRYNSNWGYLNRDLNANLAENKGTPYSTRTNYYHKPVANLNWDWKLSDNISLSTVLYASWGRGGGTGLINSPSYTSDGLMDLNKAYRDNLSLADRMGGYKKGLLMRSSVNNHQWYGMVYNFESKINDNWSMNLGFDLRSYTGLHFRQITDFLGLKGYNDSDPKRAAGANVIRNEYPYTPWKALTNYAPEDQRLNWDYNEKIRYAGVFGQWEYTSDFLSAYFQGAISRQSHEREDRYQYAKDKQKSERVVNNGYNVKTGFNFKLNPKNNLYANVGYYSRQPYHDNIYLNYGNQVNPLTNNEKIFGLEAGYSYNSAPFSVNLNLYRTHWKDKVTTKIVTDRKTQQSDFINDLVAGQLHQGVELDFLAKISRPLSLKGFISYGNWEYKGNTLRKVYDQNLKLKSEKEIEINGGKVGDSPQFQAGLGAVLKATNRLRLDLDWKYNSDLYADVVTKDNIKLPSYNLFDLGVSYEQPITMKQKLQFRLNVNNLFDTTYISELKEDYGTKSVFKVDSNTKQSDIYKGLNTANTVYFGYGRTWNFSVAYKF